MRWLWAALLVAVTQAAAAQSQVGQPQVGQPPAAQPPVGQSPEVAKMKAATEPLLTALKGAASEQAAGEIEGKVTTLWANEASPAVKLLLGRATRELSEGAPGDSLDSYDAALDLEPDLLEGWRGRARARLRMGDPAGAARDIQEVLKREPRCFLAWQDLSRIAEARGDWKAALLAWQKLLDMDPKSPGGQERLRELRRKAVGEET